MSFINGLLTNRQRFSFTNPKQLLKCNCSANFAVPLGNVKSMLHNLNDSFWNDVNISETVHWQNASEVAGNALSTFLEPYHMNLSKHSPVYQFPVYAANNDNASAKIKLCILSTVKCFGVTTRSWNIVKKLHTVNVKELRLSLLKYVTENFVKTRSMGSVYKRFHDIFPQEVVPVMRKNTQAVHIIETNLKGCIVNLNEEEKKAVTYLLWNHATNPDNLIQIESSGNNIFWTTFQHELMGGSARVPRNNSNAPLFG